MTLKELKNGIKVCHRKHGTYYVVQSCNMRMKDSQNNWVDAVVYAPLYENQFECFCRQLKSFIAEFDVVEE